MRFFSKFLIVISTLCLGILWLGGCNLHFRQAEDLPPQLQELSIASKFIYDPTITDLRHNLQGMGVQFHPFAPVVLNIDNLTYTNSIPNLIITSTAASYSFTLSLTATLTTPQGHIIIGPKSFSSSRSISVTAGLVYPPGTGFSVLNELHHDMLLSLYYWLASPQVHIALDNFFEHANRQNPHANKF